MTFFIELDLIFIVLELFFSKFDKVFIEHGNERETGLMNEELSQRDW